MRSLTPHAPRRPVRPVGPAVRIAVGIAVAAVLVTSACGQATPSPGAPTSAGGPLPAVQVVTSGAVRLEATMAPGGRTTTATTSGVAAADRAGIAAAGGLVVDYTVTDTGTQPLLVSDVVPQDLGSATIPSDVDLTHAWVYERSGVLRLSKQGFAPAPDVRFVAAPVMGGHVIAPGAGLRGRAYAVSPPELDVPGDSFEAPRAAVPPDVTQWQLCIQVDGRAGQARPAAVGGGVVQAPSTAPQGDELVCTQPAAIPVS